VSDITVSIPPGSLSTEPARGSVINLNDPLFFENNQYHFKWIFTASGAGAATAGVVHRSHKVVEGFRFAAARDLIPARLTGAVSTGNNVGWMSLMVQYRTVTGALKDATFALEVLPSKMDLDSDLPDMYETIDSNFPLWRFKLSEITQFSVSRGRNRGEFELMWLANFSDLRRKFESALKTIENAPHKKLQPRTRRLKAVRIRGKVTDRTGMKIREDMRSRRRTVS